MKTNTQESAQLQEKPVRFPTVRLDGTAVKPIIDVLLERRATSHFKQDPVPDEYLEAILHFAAQAPSGYNLQPWRFIVVRDATGRERLKRTAMDQAKVTEAPVVIIAFGIRQQWKQQVREIFREGAERGAGRAEDVKEEAKSATEFLETIPAAVWLNRHIMIAVTVMMLVAESYGLDTAPMEGLDPEAVKQEFGLPAESEVVALLALGFAQPPDKPYPGRLPLNQMVFQEEYGRRWPHP